MNKKSFGLMILIAGLLLFGINAYAVDGDLIVDGQLHVTGEVSLYRISPGCAFAGQLSTSATCMTVVCVTDPTWYYECSGICPAWEYGQPNGQSQCNNVYVGKLFP